MVETFLKDNRFLITTPNDYNALGVGTTQLYNTRRVYNCKRHGDFKLGNRLFHFVRKPYVPETVSKEFLLVDLMNNLNDLAEDQPAVLEKVKEKTSSMNRENLREMADKFGKVATKKFFHSLLS